MNNDLSSFNFENYRIGNIEKYKKVFLIDESFTLTLYELIEKFLGKREIRPGDVSLVLIYFISIYKQRRFISISPSLKII